MFLKISLKNSELLGIYMNLTNKYLIIPNKNNIKEEIIFKDIFKKNIRIINTSIGESSLIGSLSIGNDKGLIISNLLIRREFLFIRRNLPKDITIVPLQLSFNNPSAVLSVNNNLLLTSINHRKIIIQNFNSILKCKCLILNNINFTIDKYNFPMNNFCALTSQISDKIALILSSIIQMPIFCIEYYNNYNLIGSNFVLNDRVFIFGKTFNLEWLKNIRCVI
uniref:Elongation initiation factor 6 n=1 Tax=Lotharella vacuolata TaxID=74820 RepID=A0A0H5BK06_9EUKA|nr:elongation initiation factor 6 [Lotharella vacuolata]